MKNIKKVLCYLFAFITLMFIYGGQVDAAKTFTGNCSKYGCATCEYTYDGHSFTYDIKSNGDGTLNVDFWSEQPLNDIKDKIFGTQNNISNIKNKRYFIDGETNKISCFPIYLQYNSSNIADYIAGYLPYYAVYSEDQVGRIKVEANNNSSNNDLPIIEEKDGTNSKTNSCSFIVKDRNFSCNLHERDGKIIGGDCNSDSNLTLPSTFSKNYDFSDCSKVQFDIYCDHLNSTCYIQEKGKGGSNFITTNGSIIKTGDVIDEQNRNNILYSCNYTGKLNYRSLNMYRRPNDWIVVLNGTEKEISLNASSGNTFPTANCEDIFYVENSSGTKFVTIDENSKYSDAQISQLCNTSGNEVEQFCLNGKCKISSATCGNKTISEDSGCPKQLRPIITFLKKVVFNTIQLVVPILLIVMGTIDLVKAVASNDDKGNKEAISKFIKRCLTAIMVFFIVTIVTIVMNMFTKTDIGRQNDWFTCWDSID